MWIRSQNRRQLVNAIAFYIEKHIYEETYMIEAVTNEDMYDAGEYKTKERALEVLNDIQNKILRTKGFLKAENGYIMDTEDVYEMPEN